MAVKRVAVRSKVSAKVGAKNKRVAVRVRGIHAKSSVASVQRNAGPLDLTKPSDLRDFNDWLKGTGDPLTKETLAEFRDRMGLSRVEMARGMGLSERTVATLEKSGHRKAPAGTRRKVEEFVRLCLALDAYRPEGGLGAWMRSPQEWLAGSTPLHAIEVGRMDWLWRLVYQLRSGEPM